MPNPRLLGVCLDRDRFFNAHADYVISKIASKQRMISAVANTKWNWKKDNLVKLFMAFIGSIPDYAGFAWQPCASDTHIRNVIRAENRALRMISGQHLRSPIEALRQECGLLGFQTKMYRLVARSAEKAIRLPENHPRMHLSIQERGDSRETTERAGPKNS